MSWLLSPSSATKITPKLSRNASTPGVYRRRARPDEPEATTDPWLTAAVPAPLTVEQLRTMVAEGSVDTVLVAFTDMQGRLQGKRCHAGYFIDEVLPHAAEACSYLLAV